MAMNKNQPAWDKENTITAYSIITRKAEPELFEMFSKAESKSGLARELMQLAIDRRLGNG